MGVLELYRIYKDMITFSPVLFWTFPAARSLKKAQRFKTLLNGFLGVCGCLYHFYI